MEGRGRERLMAAAVGAASFLVAQTALNAALDRPLGQPLMVENPTAPESLPADCGTSENTAQEVVQVFHENGTSSVSYTVNTPARPGVYSATISLGKTQEQRTFLSETMQNFDFLEVDYLAEDAEQAQTVDELKQVLNSYASPLGWEFNFGEDDTYPSVMNAVDDNPEDGNIHVSDADLPDLRDQTVRILQELHRTPKELLLFGNIKTINIFRAWGATGNLVHDQDGNHIGLVLDNGDQVEQVIDHEVSHAINRQLCTGEWYGTDEPYDSLNNPGFVYDENADGTNFDVHAFGGGGADHNIEEDRAAANTDLMLAGLITPDDPMYNTVLQQKRELQASRLEEKVPGITEFFIARNMSVRAREFADASRPGE